MHWQVIRANETQVLVGILGDNLSLAAELVSELWDAQIKAEYMLHTNVRKHLIRANKSGIPLVVIVGEKEIKEGIVELTELGPKPEDAVRATVPRSRFVEEIQALLLRKRDSTARLQRFLDLDLDFVGIYYHCFFFLSFLFFVFCF
ncbi:hypothetical protein Droror1_Dr00005025 [Drosera rotundifolia]